MTIADITSVDPLGYECIDAKYLEEDDNGPAAIAFTLSGKVRMPRTCLPEPCARALTQIELSALTGTERVLPRFQKQWDDYYARYADFCRKEVVGFGDPEPIPRPTPENFWPPILNPPLVTDDLITGLSTPVQNSPPVPLRSPGSNQTPINRPTGTTISSPIGPAYDSGRNSCTAIADGNSFWVFESDPTGRTCRAGGGTAAGSDGFSGGGTTPTPVPLPAGILLLGGGLAALGFGAQLHRRRATRAS